MRKSGDAAVSYISTLIASPALSAAAA